MKITLIRRPAYRGVFDWLLDRLALYALAIVLSIMVSVLSAPTF